MHTLIVCHTEGLWCSWQNELNRKEHGEGRERWLALKNKIREWARHRASWDRKLRYETTYCWPCSNSSVCSGGLWWWVITQKAFCHWKWPSSRVVTETFVGWSSANHWSTEASSTLTIFVMEHRHTAIYNVPSNCKWSMYFVVWEA